MRGVTLTKLSQMHLSLESLPLAQAHGMLQKGSHHSLPAAAGLSKRIWRIHRRTKKWQSMASGELFLVPCPWKTQRCPGNGTQPVMLLSILVWRSDLAGWHSAPVCSTMSYKRQAVSWLLPPQRQQGPQIQCDSVGCNGVPDWSYPDRSRRRRNVNSGTGCLTLIVLCNCDRMPEHPHHTSLDVRTPYNSCMGCQIPAYVASQLENKWKEKITSSIGKTLANRPPIYNKMLQNIFFKEVMDSRQ